MHQTEAGRENTLVVSTRSISHIFIEDTGNNYDKDGYHEWDMCFGLNGGEK